MTQFKLDSALLSPFHQTSALKCFKLSLLLCHLTYVERDDGKNAHQIENIEWYKSWFDCGSLVHFLNGMFCRNIPILWTCWNYKKWLFYNEEEAIKVWDTILISNKKQEHKNEKNNTIPTSSVKLAYSWHFAVYIWKWFFISKIWRYNNKLSITTLENLKNIYNMKHYLLMRLKKENINKENL